MAGHENVRTIESGAHLLMQGDDCSDVFFVRAGLLKAYYIRADGKEHIKSFLPEGSVISSLVALTENGPATFSLVAMEPSEIVALPYAKLTQAAQNDLSLANSLIDFLSAYGRRKERREYELLCLTPEDRYLQLVEQAPSLAERVNQADLAAYIGVTPQALSRIKRRIRR
jgi:CRP-like cAMP-binding protein